MNDPAQKQVGEHASLIALSIRQPWAWLIVNGGKDIENRNWPSTFRGRFAIHAAKRCTNAEYQEAKQFMARVGLTVELPPLADLERGGIIGVVELVDCVKKSESPWFFGPYGFVLANAEPLPFEPCKGALKFFSPEVETA